MAVHQVIQVNSLDQIAVTFTTLGTVCFTAWMRLRQTMLVEHARTVRLSTALDDASRAERAEVVRACAALEAAISPGNMQPSVAHKAARSQEPIAPETDAGGNQCLAPSSG
jgi:hypothetical protein